MVMLWISPHLIKPIPRVNIRDELWTLWMLWCRCAHILHYLASLADAYCWSLWQGSKSLFMGVLTLTVCNRSPFEQCVGKVILKQHQAESLTFAGTEAVANLNSSCWCCCCSLGSTPVHCGISHAFAHKLFNALCWGLVLTGISMGDVVTQAFSKCNIEQIPRALSWSHHLTLSWP